MDNIEKVFDAAFDKAEASLEEYGTINISFDSNMNVLENDFISGSMSIEKDGAFTLISASLECIKKSYDYYRSFTPVKSLKIKLAMPEDYEALAVEKWNPFWTKPVFLGNKDGESANHIQQLLLKCGERYFHILPLSDEDYIHEAAYCKEDKSVSIVSSCNYMRNTKLKGAMVQICESDDPYKAVKDNYEKAYERKLIETPPRKFKEYPKQLEGLGWCTWNAFYHEVTQSGIEDKLEELAKKNIQLSWLIIDDGWSQFKDDKLCSFKEDFKKFPDGLKKFIEKIKKKYGIKYVGVWHSFTGYWFGIEKDSEVYNQQKDNLEQTPTGMLIPTGDYDKAYAFYSEWHRYLSSQGVDFLKVDSQGNALEFYKGTKECNKKIIQMHKALEQSVKENFDKAMINCMGLANLDSYYRETTAIVRNSDDFFPEKEDGFKSHIEQNAYNAIFNSQLYYCDYDMWWSKHFSAKQSSMLRAISGGPVYISDKVGETQTEYIEKLIDENKNTVRYDDAAKPTYDCIFGYQDVLKLFNVKQANNQYVIAAFNLSNDTKKVTISVSDVIKTPSSKSKYVWEMDDKTIRDIDSISFELDVSDVKKVVLMVEE